MSFLWRLSSLNLTMFATARDYREACREFKTMLKDVICESREEIVLDEIIEITPLSKNGKADYSDSGLEFSEEWLRDMNISIDIINLVTH
jgi:hypothetical protein